MGHAEAQNKLGLCYYSGAGVMKDYPEAIKWFKMAADQGDASAQNNLGVLRVMPLRKITWEFFIMMDTEFRRIMRKR